MYKVINIGNEPVALLSKASTNMYHKSIFHEDPVTIQSNDKATMADQISFSQRLTFIMCKQAEAQDAVTNGKAATIRDFMQTVTEDDFCDWLDRFELMDLQEALSGAMDVYTASSASTSTAKKE